MPVLRNVAHVLPTLMNGAVTDFLSAQLDGTAAALLQTGKAVYQFALAVAVDARNAYDFTLADLERYVIDRIALMGMRGHCHPLDRKHHLAGRGRRLFHLKLNRPAHHHIGQGLLVGVFGIHRAHIFALAQYGDPIGHRHDLVQLVGDEEDALPLLGKLTHGGHQLVDLLGSQHGGRLVKNEDLIVPVEHFQNLYPLLHTDRDILHLGVQIHAQAVFLGDLLHLFPGLFLLQEAQLGGLRAQNDIVQHRKYVDQLEVLVHHADAQRRSVIGVIDLYFLAIFADLACLRLIQAEKHAHQSRFSRAVFAQQRMDLSSAQLEGDVVIGDDTRKFLGNVEHLNDVLSLHNPYPALLRELVVFIIQYR